MHLAREISGEGPEIILLHGLTANRDRVIHGSKRLERAGYRTVSYDARSHGESDPPDRDEDPSAAYSYDALAEDLAGVLDSSVSDGSHYLLVGSSMGAHTAARHALTHPRGLAGLVLIGPAIGDDPRSDGDFDYWDALSNGLRTRGTEGFMEVFEDALSVPAEWKERLVGIELELISCHEHPEALADAIEWVPRSMPFGSVRELEAIDVPSLVIASSDETDPGHPLVVAETWADSLPNAQLLVDEPAATPLAWSGGRLSDVIADFASTHAGLRGKTSK